MVFLTAVLVVFSCIKIEEGGDTEATPIPDTQPTRLVTLEADRSASSDTRWLGGDCISVVFTHDSKPVSLTEFVTYEDGKPASKAIFTADFSNYITQSEGYNDGGYAISPSTAVEENGRIDFSLPTVQATDENGSAQRELWLASAPISLADISDDDAAQLNFTDAVSVIKFKVASDVTSVTIKGTSPFTGKAPLKVTEKGNIVVDNAMEWVEASTNVTLTPPSGAETFTNDVVYNLVVWPGLHNSMTIKVIYKELGEHETVTSESIELEPSKSYTLDLKADSGAILKEFDDALGEIGDDISDIKDRLEGLPAIMQQIQSVVVLSEYAENIAIAKYSDFSSFKKKEDISISYMIRPAAVAEELVSRFSDAISAQLCYRTSSGALNFATLPLSEASLSDDILTVKVVADGLSDLFYKGEMSAQLALQISDGQTEIMSDFISLVPHLSPGLDIRKTADLPVLRGATLSMPFSYAPTTNSYTFSLSTEGISPSDVRVNYYDASRTGYIYVDVKESDNVDDIKVDLILTCGDDVVSQPLTFVDGGPFDVVVSGAVDYIGGEVSLDVVNNSYGTYTLQLASGGWIYQTSTGVDGHYTVDYNSGSERTASVVYTINTASAVENGALKYTKSVSILQLAYGTPLQRSYFSNGECLCLQSATSSVPHKLNLVILGDGYKKKDLLKGGKFERSAASAMSAFFGVEPYATFRNRFNVFMVAYESEHEGPRLETASPDSHKTYFETWYKGGGNTYLNTSSAGQDKVIDVVQNNLGLKDNDYYRTVAILLSNTAENVGSTAYPSMTTTSSEATGDGYASFSIAMIAANSTATGGLIRHEAGGHAFGRLADEYVVSWYTPTVVNDRHSVGFYRNVATDTAYWSAFAQAGYTSSEVMYDQYITGLYRSTHENGIMWNNNGIFNAVSRWAIYDRIRKQTEGYSDYWGEFLEYDIKNR